MKTEVESQVPRAEEQAPAARAGARRIQRRSQRVWRLLGQGLLIGMLATGSHFLFSHFVLQSVRVMGRSMMPTLQDSERCLLNHWVYLFREPDYGDVVVLRDPVEPVLAVKRIIAKPGDVVCLRDGAVYLNGEKLSEPYLSPGTPTYPYLRLKEQSFQCRKDQYFVLGDNRRDSADSRTYGLIARRDILGLIVR